MSVTYGYLVGLQDIVAFRDLLKLEDIVASRDVFRLTLLLLSSSKDCELVDWVLMLLSSWNDCELLSNIAWRCCVAVILP